MRQMRRAPRQGQGQVHVSRQLDNGFPVELPVCPVCGFVYVPEELALGKVASVERALEDK